MTPSALDIGVTLLLVLPGFLSYRSALGRRADPSRRSTLWQLSEMLEYSVYTHVLGVALVFAIAAGLNALFNVDTHLDELPRKLPHEFLTAYFVEGILLFGLYAIYVVAAAAVLGAYEVPHHVATGIVRGIGHLVLWIGTIPELGRLRPPTPNFPIEPIWYKTFHVDTDEFRQFRPAVFVKMKRGDSYYGWLASYPILPDSERSKDFLIERATYAPAGHRGKPYNLVEQGGGTVLLNTADVDSIQVYYVPNDPADSTEES